MTRFAPRLGALLVAIAIVAAALVAPPRAAADEYSDATLQAFVATAIEVSQLIEAWRPHIEGAADEDTRMARIEDAQADIARAIENADGIDEDEYYAIYEAAREDEALRGRINELFVAWSEGQRVPRAQ